MTAIGQIKYGIVVFAMAFLACNPTPSSNNKLLATVYNRSLYSNELEGLYPEGATAQDSQQITTAYIDRWLRNAIIVTEAERNIPKDLNLDELLKKYRESLVLNSYEEQLTKNGLDTTIQDAELKDFYEKNKEQYQLETPIMRCYFLKLPRNTPQSDSLQKWWNSPKSGENLKKLTTYAKSYARSFILEDSIWHRTDMVVKLLPKGTLDPEAVSSGKELTMKADDYQYFFRALGVMNKQEIAPFSFIKAQASKYILHQRKIQLIEKKKQEMYDLEMKKNNVKLY